MEELEKFYKSIRANRENPEKTIFDYNRHILEFFKILNINNIEDIKKITVDDIINYKTILEEKGNALSTIKTKLSAIRSFFTFLCEREILEKNIISKSLMPKPVKHEKVIPNEREMMKIFGVLKHRKKYDTMITLFSTTGLRFSELSNLKISDFNPNENTFKIKGKGSKERIIILHEEVKDMLNKYIIKYRKVPKILSEEEFEMQHNTVRYRNFKDYNSYLKKREECEDLIFQSITGCKIDNPNFDRSLKNIAEKAGINTKEKDISAHTLRHFYGTYALNNGVPLDVVQENMGHESIQTTRIYAKTSLERRLAVNANVFNPLKKGGENEI